MRNVQLTLKYFERGRVATEQIVTVEHSCDADIQAIATLMEHRGLTSEEILADLIGRLCPGGELQAAAEQILKGGCGDDLY